MSNAQRNVALANGLVPRAPRAPSATEMAALTAECPITLSLRAVAPRLLDATRARYIGSLISDALAAGGAL